MMPAVFDVQNPSGREGGSSDSDTQDVQVQLFTIKYIGIYTRLLTFPFSLFMQTCERIK